ncbi:MULTISPECIES: chromosome segregation protein SMC [unclassified Granulicatella]|uniref:chromosome segregation protein SMC n=1 Tax=unclassified Granulicatella TaxID=2630493 RepID=UPI001073DB5F|nr:MULTISPECIES: chromosome segregation protein SMC [unclassified Granulicatella]MBF0780359.1 chromosome segregation protein SMC [Granulicatella sp. 19428wC4_WM01]TFU95491.1 chromosome segregation protein SMC [Granulicatella sp. WM01]
MNLERIEITGFKSFADKTIVEFDKGITAVVGPNGSGKSNLSEAIKWVLGEQSAKSLRGKKMDDIIFAGSQTRKALNVAEVTLVLNNEDGFLPLEFSEIQITRRLHRNGESECFINKKPCRLKDIVNLLMDSGLGKDSFSIISQGKVETIFNNRPEERRVMFEEVAGVLKYKTKKAEASRKLAKTQEHLDRVEDILHEIHAQLEPLAKQKEKALIYQEKKQELSQIDVALLVAEIDTLNEQYQVTKKEYHILTETLSQKEADHQDIEQKINGLHQHVTHIESDLTKKQAQFVQLVQKYEQIVGQYKVLRERLDFSKRDTGQQDEARFKKEQTIQSLKESIEQLNKQYADKHSAIKSAQNCLNEEKEEETFLLTSGQHVIEKERQTYIEYLQEHSRIKNELINVDKNYQTIVYRHQKLQEEQQKMSDEMAENAQKLGNSQKQLTKIEKDLTDLTHRYQQTDIKLQQLKETYQQTERTLIEQQSALNKIDARYTSLQELSEDYAGFYQGVKEILKQKNHLSGVHGAVAELIHVPKQYTTAIDIALGASMQHIITHDEQSARQAIDYLKQKRLGRATFLPLNVIKARALSTQVRASLAQEQGFIGVASELVETESIYQHVVSNLLGQTLVSENLHYGIELAKKVDYRFRIVSLEGDIIHAGGSMTGGATKQAKTTSLLSRQHELDELKKEKLRLKDVLCDLQNTIKEQKHVIDDVQQDLIRIQQEGTQQRLLEREVQLACQKLEEAQQHYEARYALLTVELDTHIKQKEEYIFQKSSLLEKENLMQQNIVKIKQHIDNINSSKEDKEKQLEALRKSIQIKTTDLAVLKEQQTAIMQQLKQSQKQLQFEEESLAAISSQLKEHSQTKEELTGLIEALKGEQDACQFEKDTVETQLIHIKEQKKTIEAELFLEETRGKELQQAIQKLLKDIGNLETKTGRFEVSIDTHLTRLSQDYALTYEAAKECVNITMTIQEASQKVSRLKQDIDQLGLVNLAAIEEYELVHERFIFMSNQQSDLLQAKDNLMGTMLEMDQEMTRRFKETFYAIKHQFEKTFPKLFGGGKATLELSDPSDLLETGVDIVAQPPGKKLQNLSLLSGGEKAFTAIALLFAILEVRPVPFCLLDEVEAALDEANVSRYGRYLKEFIDQTQFIVITHRKGTMEEANTLYGVTMQESGVSKLASVRFEDIHHTSEK